MTVPVPATAAHRPLLGGVVIPWVNVRLADGGVDFRSPHNTRVIQAWSGRLCQVCGTGLRHPIVLLAGPNQLRQLLFDEAPLHPECAVYASRACPMVAGRQSFYRSGPRISEGHRGEACFEPGCECGGWLPTPGIEGAPGGDPAHPWFAVYVAAYTVVHKPNGVLHGGMVLPGDVRAVRVVSTPGTGREWRSLPLAEALAGYEAPTTDRREI